MHSRFTFTPSSSVPQVRETSRFNIWDTKTWGSFSSRAKSFEEVSGKRGARGSTHTVGGRGAASLAGPRALRR